VSTFIKLPYSIAVSVNVRKNVVLNTDLMSGTGRSLDFGHTSVILPQGTLPSGHVTVDEFGNVQVQPDVIGAGTAAAIPAPTGTEESVAVGAGAPEAAEEAVAITTPWLFAHDARRFSAEVAALDRFLTDIKKLALIEAARPAGESVVTPELIGHLVAGRSLHSYPDMDDFASRIGDWTDRIIFELDDVRFASPLFGRLKSYVKWDGTANWNTAIALISILMNLHGAVMGGEERIIVVYEPPRVEEVVTNPMPGPEFQLSYRSYKEDIERDQVRSIQLYLKMLGYYDASIDGEIGPITRTGVALYCSERKLACDQLEDRIFQESIAREMARSFPIVTFSLSDE